MKPAPPAQWPHLHDLGGRVDYDSWTDAWYAKDGIVLHHTGGTRHGDYTYAEGIQKVLRYEDYHIDGRGWRGLAYSVVVLQTGDIIWVRGWNQNGAHYGSDDIDGDGISANKEKIAVLFVLGGGEPPTPEALTAFETRLRPYLETEMGMFLPLYRHSEVAASGGHSTACPGSLGAYIDADRAGILPWPNTLRRGDDHAAVRMLRGYLYGLGHLNRTGPAPYDHRFTRAVDRAVREFQTGRGITVDGIVGPDTRRHLYTAIAATERRS